MRIRCLLVVSTLVLFPSAALAQAPQLWDPAYTIRHWTTDDGLPTNAVLSAAHDTDDFLWLATNDGLVRFDGIQMEVFNRSTTEALPVNRFDAIHTDAEGRLTFSSRQRHFVQYYNRSFHHFPSTTRGTAVRVEADSIWLGTEAGLRLLTHTADAPYRPDMIYAPVSGIVRDGDGFLWVATRGQGLVRLAPNGNAHTFTRSDGLPQDDILDLYPAPDGSLWLLTRNTLIQYTAGTFHQRATFSQPTVQPVAEGARALLLPKLHVDTAGRVWIRSNAWLPSEALHNETRVLVWTPETNTLTPWNADDGAQARIRTLATDAAGTTWLIEHRDRQSALYRGRARFADLPTQTNALHLSADGILWVATGSGLYQIRPRPVQALVPRFAEGRGFIYALVEAPDGTLSAPVPNQRRLMHITPEGVTAEALPGRFYRTVFLTRDGTRWLGGDLCRYDQSTCTPVRAGPEQETLRGVIAALEDRNSRFWIGTHDALWEGRTDQAPEQWRKHPFPKATPGDRIQILYETPGGELLMGTQLSGMARIIRPATPVDSIRYDSVTEAHGLASSNIRDLYQAPNGILWIATADKGLCRLELGATPALADGAIQCLDVADGLHTPSLHRILPDDHGRLWFNSNQGIFWIARSDLDAWAAGERPMVSSVAYSEADGLPIREGNGGVQNAGLRTTDGVLYFPTMEGLAIIDPAHLPLPDAPTPYIRTVRIGTTSTTPQASLTLPPEERNVSFVFTAPAFIKPESVLFQYRLVGFDDVWQMADSRTATYTNLPPGPYRFEVRAGLGGAWGDVTGQAFRRGAFFWETSMFWGSVGVLILALFAFAYRQKQQQAVRLQHAVDARTTELQQSNAALLESKNRIAKQADALQRADDLKTRFLTNISHEFRTPLTLTFGPIDDLLHGHFASLEAARPHFNRARRNGSRLLRLINQLLDLSQLGAGAARLRAQPGDLSEFMRTVVAPFVSLAERRRITFVVEVPAEPLPFVFDTDKIEKIVVNLLSNAFKFTPKEGTVTVQLTAVPHTDTVQLVVADTGVGIAAEHLPHLFEQFYQVDDGPTRSHEGSGVGLALVKELATLHGGSVEVTSTVGKGTQFVVSVASVAATDSAEPSPVGAVEDGDDLNEPVSGDGMATPEAVRSEHVVLVVEDNPDMRAYLVDHLSPFYTVREAKDGQDGLEQAQADVPDLVLTDVMMPRLDGLGLCAALKADRATSHIPILMLSAKADVASRITAYQTGADAYFPKPFDARELRARIQALLIERARLWERMRTVPADTAQESTAPEQTSHVLPPLEAAFLADVDACLAAHLSDPDFNLNRLAEALNLSPRQVHRKLSALVDETPTKRLRRMRFEEAKRLLRAGTLTVKQVAFAVGFKSESAFTRSFRQHVGTVPSAYLPEAMA